MDDNLPPMPEPARPGEIRVGDRSPDYWSADQMRAYAAEAVRMERERCAKIAQEADVETYEFGGQTYDDAAGLRATILSNIRNQQEKTAS